MRRYPPLSAPKHRLAPKGTGPIGRRGPASARPALTADLAHRAVGPEEVHLADGVTGPLRADGPLDLRRQVVVAAAAAQDAPQVELTRLEQARTQLALGREPHPVAVAAERFGDRRDHADIPGAVDVAPTVGGGRTPSRQRLEGVHGVDGGDDLVLAHHIA